MAAVKKDERAAGAAFGLKVRVIFERLEFRGHLTIVAPDAAFASATRVDVLPTDGVSAKLSVVMSLTDEPYELRLEERPQYLYAHVSCETVSADVALHYLAKIADRCKEIGAERLMLHRDIPEMLPDGSLFWVSTKFQEMILGVKAAFINPYDANDASMDFAMQIGTNRGAIHRSFRSESDAEKWLLEDL